MLPTLTVPTRPWERIAIATLLLVTCGLLIYLAWRTGITADEPGHLVGAELYWEGADRLPPGDMPPLIKLVGGWVPRSLDLPLPDDLGTPGDTRREWEVALTMMERLQGQPIGKIFFLSRLPLIVFPLLTICIVWWWARELFSPATALIAACLFALEPTALAHGALFKNDHAAAFAYILFWYAVWRYWRTPSPQAAGAIALATVLCMISKLSLMFVFGAAPVLILLSDVRGRRWPRWKTVGIAVGVCLGAYLLLLAAAQFDIQWLTANDLRRMDADRTLPAWFAAAARAFTVFPVPVRMWAGTTLLMSGFAYESPVYLFGTIYPHGHPLYFVAALLVKAPVTLIVLGSLGAVLLAVGLVRRRLVWSDLLWILPGPLYVFLASRVPVQLGVRLVMPGLPFGILVCAFVVERARKQRIGRVALIAGLALFAFETARVYPFGISFFNIAAGGPAAGYRYLVDSNLDWGQGLGELERWARANRVIPIGLSYFGGDMTFRYFQDNEVDVLPPPWTDKLAKGRTQLIPEAGHYYAISPTLLPGHFFAPKYRDYYARFRAMTPVARPGYSMFVYHVDALPH